MKLLLPLFALTLSQVPLAGLVAQTYWVQVPTQNAPSPRRAALLVHDTVRDRIVLYGGYSGQYYQYDTWEFDGTDWSQRLTNQTPSGGRGAMAYDRGRQRTVLVTGNSSGALTWEYDGAQWTTVNLPQTPPVDGDALMVYDASRGVLVLVLDSPTAPGGATWEYDGFVWTQRLPLAALPPLAGAELVYDPLRARTLLHGGYNGQGNSGRTWEYDGAGWSLASNAWGNPVAYDFAFAFDAHRRRAVLFGGAGPNLALGTYEYDGTWQPRTQSGPSPRFGATMVYDAIRQQCVLFGGTATTFGGYYNDTYCYRALAPARALTFGQGCAGTGAAPGLLPAPYHVPYLGMAFTSQLYGVPYGQPSFLAFGLSRTNTAGVPLPLSLQTYGLNGCTLWISPDTTRFATGTGSNAAVTFQVPNTPGLVGVRFYEQGFALDPGGNAAGLIVTRALECTIGDA